MDAKKYTAILKKCSLFAGISSPDLTTLLGCLPVSLKSFEKDTFIFMAGDEPSSVGIVLSGGAFVQQTDFWGNRTILSHVGPAGLFCEAFSCAGLPSLPVSVFASEKSDILFIDCRRIIKTCSSACKFHTELIKNLVQILAAETIKLTRKIEHLTRRNTREKLISYLSQMSAQAGSDTFIIPMNRQELADYFAVDRSALSNDLSKMRKEGVIDFHKNRFTLLSVKP